MNNINNNQASVDYPALYEEMRSLQGWNWWFKIHYPAILDLLKGYLKPGMLVLDLGSAGGWSTADLPAEVKRIILDLRPIALKLTEGKIFGRVCGDGHKIPLKTGACDLVVCEGLLHQCEAVEPRRIVEEMVRICRPGGIIISVEPAFNCLFGSHDLVFGGCRRFTIRSLMNLFAGLPVKDIRKTYLHLFVFLPTWLVRKFAKRATTDLALGNSLTNNICIGLGTIERWLTRLFPMPFGITAAVLLRREEEPGFAMDLNRRDAESAEKDLVKTDLVID